MRFTASLLAMLLLLLLPASLAGQARSVLSHPAPWSSWTASLEPSTERRADAESAGDYHREGMVIGGAVLGLAGGALAYGICSGSEDSSGCAGQGLLGLGVGALLGIGLGALIGGLFPKSH